MLYDEALAKTCYFAKNGLMQLKLMHRGDILQCANSSETSSTLQHVLQAMKATAVHTKKCSSPIQPYIVLEATTRHNNIR